MDFKRLTGIDLEQTLKEKILTAKAHLTDPGDLMYGSVVSEGNLLLMELWHCFLLLIELWHCFFLFVRMRKFELRYLKFS